MALHRIQPLRNSPPVKSMWEAREIQTKCINTAMGIKEEARTMKGLTNFVVQGAQSGQWQGQKFTLLIYDDLEKEKEMELKIRGSEVIYDAGDREYRLTEMQESHIMNVLGKFELQRMVLTRLSEASTFVDNTKQLKFCTKKMEKLDKKIEVFIEELMRRSKAEKALKKLKASVE